ncbi:DUF4142 domain-containing protein [Legionella micdadei]|uniref:Membrane protein n=1 Tax=Legionella micdadei TaxID=451 RepID=A0A098GHL5_LEGMI|nr:DUF4142 domain-containing protein [Legionella micdadei]ARG96667.1 hypothetical protein B6N58_02695 [Legionella micdadei]KTD26330.1 hypothetical protein Lmic_2424 [Legionella micdadei]NSL19094.1 DUF4142 domain-containing protein [Legionella micdadei]CEG61959.1 protein of unknown function [Legionella micdadei]SCY67619.1 putative membrane protein [Legionella micdadei]
MKLKLTMSLILGAVIALPSCTPVTNYNNPPPVNGALTSAQAQTDAKILGAVAALDQNEIALATLAQNKATDMSVRRYADWMYKEHNNNLQNTLALSKKIGVMPQNGPAAVKLQKNGKRELVALNHTKGMQFDQKYIAMMVKGHTEAVNLLNGLIKIASSPALVRELESTRHHVIAHLHKAQAIQKEMAHS